jgi:hypothetical protein
LAVVIYVLERRHSPKHEQPRYSHNPIILVNNENDPGNKPEITDHGWVIMWERFKKDADQILSDLRILGNLWMDRPFEFSMWSTLNGILQFQSELEKLITESGPDNGCTRYPTPLFQGLIRAVAESSDPEIRERLEELDLLRQKAEEIWTVNKPRRK